MSFAVTLTNDYALPRLTLSAAVDRKIIFRSASFRMVAEAFTLAGLSFGLFSLFLGLSVL